MNIHMQTKRSSEAGFTLVELAIVMIIIGLLIGGILKGQELIKNAQAASTVAQLKGIQAGMSTFRDNYNALPGDMVNANGRLPTCLAASNCFNGSGDNLIGTPAAIIGTNTGAAEAAAAAAGGPGESGNFWRHLGAADLVGGNDSSNVMQFGQSLPAANIGGGFVVSQHIGGAIPASTAGAADPARAGVYLTLRGIPNIASTGTAGQEVMTATAAERIDRKMDDSAPNGGTVRALGPVGAGIAGCSDVATNLGVYNVGADGQNCSLAIRMN